MITTNIIRIATQITAAAALIATGIALGQKQGASKFAKYLQPASISAMDFATLRATVDLIRGGRTIPAINAPEILYDAEHDEIHAAVFIDNIGEHPADRANTEIVMTAKDALHALRRYIPELSEKDFVLTVHWLKQELPPGTARVVVFGEYRNGNVVIGK